MSSEEFLEDPELQFRTKKAEMNILISRLEVFNQNKVILNLKLIIKSVDINKERGFRIF